MTPKKGFSGATINLVANTDKIIKEYKTVRGEIHQQGKQCKLLYPVTPFVYEIGDGYYTMERLDEPPDMTTEVACKMLADAEYLLSKMVWTNQAPERMHDWRAALVRFVKDTKNMSNIAKMLEVLYPSVDIVLQGASILRSQLTHGDPTLANMMYRGKQLCIIDPMIQSIKIADHWTADVGKMMQSAIGWEIVTLNWRYTISNCVWHLLRARDYMDVLRIWFWCMIHCVRILPYVQRSSRESKWARHCASIIHTKLEPAICGDSILSSYIENPACITLSILTEL